MPRGGYQKPSKPATVSGPGRFSKRTDGQPKAAPDLDTPGQRFGDRQMLEAAQGVAPAAGAQGATIQRRMQGSAPAAGGLPPWLLGMDSANPLEPATAGMALGPGPGPEVLSAAEPPEDEREVVLTYLAETFQNATAARHLAEIREEKAASMPPAPVPSGSTMPSSPELATEPGTPELA